MRSVALSSNYTFIGAGDWSLDATSGFATDGGTVQALVPVGSVVQKAFLYESTFSDDRTSGVVTLTGGSAASTNVGVWTDLGLAGFLGAWRADVTDFVRGVVGGGSNSAFNFNLSNITNNDVDGYALVVVYSNPTKTVSTISLLDGFSAQGGDAFTASFTKPINTTVPGFTAEMSLGIGFSFEQNGGDQRSYVSVNGRLLTSSAGGEDDGVSRNGGLITIGGIGDSNANPVDPTVAPTNPRTDDELYNLAAGNGLDSSPFITNGDTQVVVQTNNPTFDDNIFFAGFKITGVANIDTSTNDAPVAVNDGGAGFRTNENTSFKTGNVLLNDFDPESQPLTIVGLDTTGTKGLVTSNGDGTFTYNPDGKFAALNTGDLAFDSFTYTISDGEKTATATAVVTIDGIGGTTPPPTNSEYIVLGNGSDVADFHTRTSRVVVNAGAGDDQVIGTNFNDSINGGTGNDRINGGGGNDVIRGNAGQDRVSGGTGNDTFLFLTGDLTTSKATADQVIDFHGAGKFNGNGENDFIGLAGYGAGSTLVFDSYLGGDMTKQYYRVIDSANPSQTGWLLVQMADGTNKLALGDYSFY